MNPTRALEGLYRNLFDNPILTRELRRRMRGKALVISMIGYIVLMTATSILVLLARVGTASLIGGDDTQAMLQRLSETGTALFWWVSLIQGLLVLIIAPTITAGMTTGEKERQTFDFLRVTTISPWMYIVGCFLSTVFYVTLALLCALPLISLAFLYGGVGRGEVVRMFAFLLATSMVLSAFGLYISSVRERTRTAQGIVVFVIFAIVFGGSIAYSALMRWLGGGALVGNTAMASSASLDMGVDTGTTGTAAATAGGAAMAISPDLAFVLALLGLVALAVVFLLMATRKLFEPEESRALSHVQFGVLFIAISWMVFPVLAYVPGSNLITLLFLSTISILFATAACVFAVGRMEVGDEIWHLKRLFPFLRPFDQTVPFLVLIGLVGWLMMTHFFEAMNNQSVGMLAPFGGRPSAVLEAPPAGLRSSFLLLILTSYAFFCVFGRFATAVSIGRRGAGRMTLGMIAALWVGVPLIAQLLTVATPLGSLPSAEAFLSNLSLISPFALVIHALADPNAYPAVTALTAANGAWAASVYLVLALALGIYAEYLRWRRWRGFDYHYDMELA